MRQKRIQRKENEHLLHGDAVGMERNEMSKSRGCHTQLLRHWPSWLV